MVPIITRPVGRDACGVTLRRFGLRSVESRGLPLCPIPYGEKRAACNFIMVNMEIVVDESVGRVCLECYPPRVTGSVFHPAELATLRLQGQINVFARPSMKETSKESFLSLRFNFFGNLENRCHKRGRIGNLEIPPPVSHNKKTKHDAFLSIASRI
jgi:hypothetical protein